MVSKKKQNTPAKRKSSPKYNPIFERMSNEVGGVRCDLGCGFRKAAGFVGVDFRKGPGVDIVQDLSLFPWREIPDDVASIVMTSHLNEHINPASSNPQLAALINLLKSKGVLTEKEVDSTVGEYNFLGGFIRFMDEVWRITKVGGKFMMSHPYAGSPGYWQDPTHINPINQATYAYFDPFAKEPVSGQFYGLYGIYRPKPWKLVSCSYTTYGNMEVLLEKRDIDPSYNVSTDNGLTSK